MNRSKKAPRALGYSYLRFSTPDQIKGDSQRRQLEASRTWCKENNAELVEELQDHGVSAFRGKNRMLGVLARFLELVRAGEIKPGTFFIIENIDRLSREKVLEALTLYLELIKGGVSIVTLIDGQTHSRETIQKNPMVLQMAIASMARANEESAVKSERINAKWEQSRKDALAGKPSAMGRLPCWMKRNRKTREPELIEKVASVVAELFAMAANGLTPNQIATKLNKSKRPPLTTRGRSNHWTLSSLRKILKSKSAMGTLIVKEPYKDEEGKRKYREVREVAGYYPAAVTPEIFSKVQTIYRARAKNSTHGTGGSHRSDSNAFSGLAQEMKSGCGVQYTFSNCKNAAGVKYRNEYLRAQNTFNAGLTYTFAWSYKDFSNLFLATCRLAMKAASNVSQEEAALSVLENEAAEAGESMAALLSLAKKATSAKAELLAELEKEATKKKRIEDEAESLRDQIRAAKKKRVILPAKVEDRVKLRRVLRANVSSLRIDFEAKAFECKLFSGVSYSCWLSPENAVFVETSDFEVPVDAFKGLEITQSWGRMKRRKKTTLAAA